MSSDHGTETNWLRILRWVGPICIVFIAVVVGGFYYWEEFNRENFQPTLDGRSGSESFKLQVGGGETELHVDFVRKTDHGGIALAFPFGTRTCTLMLDVPDPTGGLKSGLDLVDGKRFFDPGNVTYQSQPLLSTGALHQVSIRSLRNEIRVTLDNQPLIVFQGLPNSISASPDLPEMRRKDQMVIAIKSKIRVYNVKSHMAKEYVDFPVEDELGTVGQVIGQGSTRELTAYAMRVAGAPVRLFPASKLVNFDDPFTLEFWFRRSESQSKWVSLTSGRIGIELENSEVNRIHLWAGSGGVHGPSASTMDTQWHHLALCHDGYYLMLYLDGVFVCRALSTYHCSTEPMFCIGDLLSEGHRNTSFRGDIREIRVSSIARYPMGHAFSAPSVMAADEYTLARVRFDEKTSIVEAKLDGIELKGRHIHTVETSDQ